MRANKFLENDIAVENDIAAEYYLGYSH